MRSSLWFMYFTGHAHGVVSKSSPSSRASRFSPMLYSGSLIVFCFTFKHVIHFEFTFSNSVRSVSIFSCSRAICRKDHLSPVALPALLCQRSAARVVWVCFWALCFMPRICLSVLPAVRRWLGFCSFMGWRDIRQRQSSGFVFLQRCWQFGVVLLSV